MAATASMSRRAWVVGLVASGALFVSPVAAAFSWDDLWRRPDQQAHRLYEEGQMDGAARTFTDDRWRAAAWHKAKAYDRALRALADDGSVPALYNKGNALAHLGRLPEALSAYDEALRIEPEHADARFNRDLVAQMLEEASQGEAGEPGESGESPDGEEGEEGQGEQAGDNAMAAEESESNAAEASGAGPGGQGESAMMEQQEGQDPTGEQEQDQQGMAAGDAADPDADSETEAMAGRQDEEAEQQQEKAGGLADQKNDGTDEETADSVMLSDRQQQLEKDMAVDLWLRNINATDSVFLRRKFQHQHKSKQRGGR